MNGQPEYPVTSAEDNPDEIEADAAVDGSPGPD